MTNLTLSNHQLALMDAAGSADRRVFFHGPAGAGKTTVGVEWLLRLLQADVPARSILVLAPQRTLALPYYAALRRPTVRPGGQVTIATVGGLAQRMVDLFWTLIAEPAGFAHPDQPPTFLTLETAQYYMARLVRPLLEEGYFETVVIDRNRLYSQIIDNLNKAAVVGFPYTEIGDRLKAAWSGEQTQRRIYDEAPQCATRFRAYCLAHNLLDFSLQVEVFARYLWKPALSDPADPTDSHSAATLCRDYLLETYTHLIADNVEEDTPVAHDVLRDWLDHCQSALLICDEEAGYRRFLGADPEDGLALGDLCDERVRFDEGVVTAPGLTALGTELAHALNRAPEGGARAERSPLSRQLKSQISDSLIYEHHRYHPQMLDWVADQIAGLVHEEEVPPGEIVVLAPYLTDALRFSLMHRLEQRQVDARSHRPSRALREEPATRCLLTLSAIAHPAWGIRPDRFDVAYALMQAIEGLDLVRAQLLAEIVYRVQDGALTFTSFDQIKPSMQERLTYLLGERYERLRVWLTEYAAAYAPTSDARLPFDHFLSRLFGELLSQVGFGFHADYDAGRVAHDLIESVRKFRWVAGGVELGEGGVASERKPLGQEYLEMVQDGVIAAQYIRGWRLQSEEAVLLAPAYTFLMNNRPVDYQFWLNVGGRGWWERLYQPLTHPYVLSRRWPYREDDQEMALWTDADEVDARQDALYRLVLGLLRRCRRRIYLGLSELGEQGYEQKGALLHAIQRVLRRLPAEEGVMYP